MTPSQNDLHVLVTGATGNQGGAVARELIDRGHRVRGLTRDPNSSAARALSSLGAEMVQGDFTKPESLARALEGVDAVFAMATPFEQGMEAETEQGLNLVNAVAKADGIEHLVYSSVASAREGTGIPHFESKVPVGERVEEIDVPSTIVGPVFFAENLTTPWFLPPIKEGTLALAMPTDRTLQTITLPDLGSMMVSVFEGRETFTGERIEIATDELTPHEMAQAISAASGRKIEAYEVPLEEMMEQSEDFGLMFQWFDEVGYSVDIDALRSTFPKAPFDGFDTWARQVDWSILDE